MLADCGQKSTPERAKCVAEMSRVNGVCFLKEKAVNCRVIVLNTISEQVSLMSKVRSVC
jgi:hypothetical protein